MNLSKNERAVVSFCDYEGDPTNNPVHGLCLYVIDTGADDEGFDNLSDALEEYDHEVYCVGKMYDELKKAGLLEKCRA